MNTDIAKFMGWNTKIFQVYQNSNPEPIWFRPGEDFPSNYFRSDELEFSTSWDWLMPVVEKIESLGYDTGICRVLIKGEELSEVLISPRIKNNHYEVHNRTDQSKLEAVHSAVVMFINTYNLQQP